MAARRRRLTKVMAVAMVVVGALGLAGGLGWAGASAEHYGLIWTSDARSWHLAQLLGPLVGRGTGTKLAMLGWPEWFGAGYGEAVWGELPRGPGQVVGAILTTRMSLSSEEEQGNSVSSHPSISASGRFVAFQSDASNLVPGDTNGHADVFVRDRQTGTTERVSISSQGEQGNDHSLFCSISASGRFVAFTSSASNLVPGDTNVTWDVFVRDRQTGKTERISVSSEGQQGNGASVRPAISADGRFVAFTSEASNLVPGDTNGKKDIFVRDRQTGKTERVSVSSNGQQGNWGSDEASISADGRFVAFSSDADNLVPGDTNGKIDVFLRDRQTGKTERVSISIEGQQANGHSGAPSISADAHVVAFESEASNLVPGDTNGKKDVFVRDRQTAKTERVSVSSQGGQGNEASAMASTSAFGRFVVFESKASNLVPGDTNGKEDVFVRDRQTAKTERVSISSGDKQGNDASGYPSISAYARFVAFSSLASNLVPGDTNGYWDVFVRERSGPGEPFPRVLKPTSTQE